MGNGQKISESCKNSELLGGGGGGGLKPPPDIRIRGPCV